MKTVLDFLAAVGSTTLRCLAALGDFSLFAMLLLRHCAVLVRKPLDRKSTRLNSSHW